MGHAAPGSCCEGFPSLPVSWEAEGSASPRGQRAPGGCNLQAGVASRLLLLPWVTHAWKWPHTLVQGLETEDMVMQQAKSLTLARSSAGG